MEGIVTLLDGFYADLVPKSLEAGLSLILQDLGPLLFLLLFSCFFFFFGFYNLKLPLRFLSITHTERVEVFVCQKTSPVPPASKKACLDPDDLLCFFVRKLCFSQG